MIAIGLTGGIASGKTTIANLFQDLGVPVIDTDIISRELLQPNEIAYQQVIAHFSNDIVDDNHQINRAKLRQLVFSNNAEKQWLERMLHPLIYQRCHDWLRQQSQSQYVMVVVPLLFETNFQSLVDRVLAVDCNKALQISRLLNRDSIDENLANSMLNQQLNNEDRIARAHDTIVNETDMPSLKEKVLELHQKYLLLADT
ncbi:MAG: dephospho-CoA kinase [Pseudomonadota bacterium]